MHTGISIGNHTPVDQIETVAAAIKNIFDAGYDNSMDQETVRHALDMLAKAVSISGVAVQGVNLDARTINVDTATTHA